MQGCPFATFRKILLRNAGFEGRLARKKANAGESAKKCQVAHFSTPFLAQLS